MDSFTNQQLQLIITQLDQAIQNHDCWYKNLLRVLVAHLSPEETDLMPDAHRRCLFGQWYDSSQAEFIKEHPAFVSLGASHEKMHHSARVLLQRITENTPIAVSDWDQFSNHLESMRLAFQILRHEFADAVQNRDPLTEAQTRTNLLTNLSQQQALVERERQSCALVMLDLDHFKHINDEYGHAAGDEVLVSTVKCIKSALRPYDQIYRYGGEEFIICMPDTTVEQARQAAERMRSAVEAQCFQFDGSDAGLNVTASFGVSALSSSFSVEETMDLADQAMYKAKSAGRNRVVVDD